MIQVSSPPPISIDKSQLQSLTQKLAFLQEFLEGYSRVGYTEEADPMESRIADAAYAAEDVIESHITDAGSIRSASTAQNVTMVGLDDVLYQMLDKITGGRHDRQIIPIVGMGRIGKTTLARNIYVNPLVQEHFNVCAWSTISQEHISREILEQVLGQVKKGSRGDLSEYELGEQLYRCLIDRRYIVVMDDMWSIEAWDEVKTFFPDNGNRSRIIVTTWLSHLASEGPLG